jgi:hypothetical protein
VALFSKFGALEGAEMLLGYSIKSDLIGKTRSNMAGMWESRIGTPQAIVETLYRRKYALTHAILENHAALAEYVSQNPGMSNRRLDYFQGAQLLVIDIDWTSDVSIEKLDPETLFDHSFLTKYLLAAIPSSSFHPTERPNWHFFFALDSSILNTRYYRDISRAFQTVFTEATGLPADRALSTPVQPTYGTQWKHSDMGTEYPEKWVYVNNKASLYSLDALDDALVHTQEVIAEERLKHYAGGQEASQHVAEHLARSSDDREKIVLEALSYVLKGWGSQDYQTWTRMWFAAHHGSPSEAVCDFILKHPDIDWGDGNWDDAQHKFTHDWENHQQQEEGVTVATLFWMARENGWLTESPYDIEVHIQKEKNKKQMDLRTFKAARISEWVQEQDNIPHLVMIKSQTGTGKTYNLISLYERLGRPRSVIFSPTIKLGADLTSLLQRHGLPATFYRDETGKRLSVEEMAEADILVTTLQSFATTVYASGYDMNRYGLVYIEESDQLLTGFVRSRNRYGSSHVSDHEARAGLTALAEAIRTSRNVWAVDATMTEITRRFFKAFAGRRRIGIFRNTHSKSKAPVRMVASQGEALEIGRDALALGKRVVIACDTARNAEIAYRMMVKAQVVKAKEAILITASRGHTKAVKDFMDDVNGEAARYKLVAYNSAMGSGVSITEVEADLVVQIANYLSPRQNLQILNRYRRQRSVVCYYTSAENLYAMTSSEIMEQAQTAYDSERMVFGLEPVQRSEIAEIRDYLGALSIADVQAQRRASRDFYIRLLENDGRSVYEDDSYVDDELVESLLKDVRETMKNERQQVREQWRFYPRIGYDTDIDEDADLFEIACGLYHERIFQVFDGNIPNNIPNEDLGYMVEQAGDAMRSMWLSVEADRGLVESFRQLRNEHVGYLTLRSTYARLHFLTIVWGIYRSGSDAEVTDDVFDLLLMAAKEQPDMFAALSVDPRHTVDYFLNQEDGEFKLVRALLKRFGFRLSRRRRTDRYYISNYEEISTLARLRYGLDVTEVLVEYDSSWVENEALLDDESMVYLEVSGNDVRTMLEVFG